MAKLLANVVVDRKGKQVTLVAGEDLPEWAVGKVSPALVSGEVVVSRKAPPEDAFGVADGDDEPRPVFQGD